MKPFTTAEELRTALIALAQKKCRSDWSPPKWANQILQNDGFAKSLSGFMFNAIARGRFYFRKRLAPIISRKVWYWGESDRLGNSAFADLDEDAQSRFRRAFKMGLHDSLLHKLVGQFLNRKIDPLLSNRCCAYRAGRGQAAAVKTVREMQRTGDRFVVRLDVKSFNETVSHKVLVRTLETRLYPHLAEGERHIVEGTLNALFELSALATKTPGFGLIVGSGLTPALTNLYLSPLDEYLDRTDIQGVRYGDDVVAFCRTQAEAEKVLKELCLIVQELDQRTSSSPAFGEDFWRRGLENRFTPEVDVPSIIAARKQKRKTDIFNPGEPFDFVGFEFADTRVFIRQATLVKVKSQIEKYTQRSAARIADAIERNDRRWGAIQSEDDSADQSPASLAFVSPQYVAWSIQRINGLLGFQKSKGSPLRPGVKYEFLPGRGFACGVLKCVSYEDVKGQFQILDRYAYCRLSHLIAGNPAYFKKGAPVLRPLGFRTFKDVVNRYHPEIATAEPPKVAPLAV